MEPLKKVTVFPLCRPELNNKHIECYFLWARDNFEALKRYFEALCRIPLEGNQENVRFDVWMVIQYEIEQANESLS